MRTARSAASRSQAFICPSDPAGSASPPGWNGGNNYYGNEGSWLCDACQQTPSTIAPGYLPQGPLYNRSCVNLASMTDGTSQTAFLSERRRGQGTPDIKSDMYMMGSAMTIDQTWQMCNRLDMTMAHASHELDGGDLVHRRHDVHDIQPRFHAEYAHLCLDERRHDDAREPRWPTWRFSFRPRAAHPGGVKLLFGDGSVRFIKESIALAGLACLEHAERRRGCERVGLLMFSSRASPVSRGHGSRGIMATQYDAATCAKRCRLWRAGWGWPRRRR